MCGGSGGGPSGPGLGPPGAPGSSGVNASAAPPGAPGVAPLGLPNIAPPPSVSPLPSAVPMDLPNIAPPPSVSPLPSVTPMDLPNIPPPPSITPMPNANTPNPLSEAFKNAFKTMAKVDTVASMTGVIPPGMTTLLGTPILAMSQFAEGDPNFSPGVSGPEGNAAQGGGPASLPVPGPNSITQPLVQPGPSPVAPMPQASPFDQGDYANRLTGQALTPDQFMALLTQARGF